MSTMKPWFQRHFKRVLFGLFGGALLIGGLSACGHHRDGQGWAMNEEQATQARTKIVERVSKELDLNEPQKQGLSTLADKLREQRQALVGKTTDPRADIQSLVTGTQFDKAKALAIVEEKTSALQLKSPEVIAAAAAFYDSLNPVQQQKVRDFMQHRGRWFRHA
jgi:Spy/CpxP family protein refolding chaperone